MGRFGCLLFGLVIALLWGGGQGIYTGLSNTKQTELSLADYTKQKPTATWLKLKDCQVNTLDAAYSSKWGSIKEVYIPLSVPGAGPGEKIHVLLATEDSATIKFIEQMNNVKTDQEGLKFAIENKEKLMAKRDVEGVIRFGIDLKDKDRRKLAALDKNLTPDFVIISEGEKPQIILSIVMFGGGIVLLLVLLGVLGSSKSSGDDTAEAKDTPSSGPRPLAPPPKGG